ncbi:type 1 glutamine amidotransferase domain-containing protein [Rivularia sp. UHCC 0363]|uniref:type 1 glutamine amidotransferase domain-containing protein n=1 Tax=Rivularia sp. UHCC 0363 TaxID=3110244 RepID=UPI002B21D302|nr:type 1 glutamine amidotransferase domain-containing protein [Rivularia sp. UHCC 0363]MEA5594517.1 type 1 glutamine amidotransferase domain-containing protein [Rivularia sp. UHCC 0363]
MTQELNNKKIAILVADGFEQVEMTKPKHAFEDAGAQTHIISINNDRVQGWNHFDKADFFSVDVSIDKASSADYDALLLPGGVANPDQLRTNDKAVQFVKSFFDAGKPVAAICHALWTLIEAKAVSGRTLTSWSSLKTDLENAGANWVDREVVEDNGLVTSRNPDDIPAFNAKAIELFAKELVTK